MSEFEEKLGAILGDAEAMDQIMALAQSLSAKGGEGERSAAQEDAPPTCAPVVGETGRDARLLSALRPYLRPERQERIDRTLELLSMIRMIRGLK